VKIYVNVSEKLSKKIAEATEVATDWEGCGGALERR
jgi:hypothetical protein